MSLARAQGGPVLWLALATYLLHRLLVLHTAFDTVAIPVYELGMGNLAWIAQGGWRGAPLTQFYDNCGGHLVVGLAAAPLYALLGSSYMALKLVPVLLGAGTVLLLWSSLRRVFGQRAAGYAVWFFVLGPPLVTKFSMIAMGNHFENLFFQALVLWLFFRLHEEPASPRRPRRLAACAAAAGFAQFVYAGSALLLAVLAGVHLAVRGARASLRDLRLALPAFALGLAPLAWAELRTGGRTLEMLRFNFSSGSGGAPERLASLATDVLPQACCFPDLGPLRGAWADRLWIGALLAASLALLPGLARGAWAALRRRAPLADPGPQGEAARFRALATAPFLLHLPLFAAAYALSDFRLGPYAPPVEVGTYRYLVPSAAFGCLLLGLAVARARSSARPAARALGTAAAVLTLALGAWNAALVRPTTGDLTRGWRYPGHELATYASTVLRDSSPDPATGALTWDDELVGAWVAEFDPASRQRIAEGMGFRLALAQELAPGPPRDGFALDLDALTAPYAAELAPALARGAGSFLGQQARRPRQRERVRVTLQGLAEHAAAPHLVEGLALEVRFLLGRELAYELRHVERRAPLVPPALAPAFERGRQRQLERIAARGIAQDVALVERARARLSAPAPDPSLGAPSGPQNERPRATR